MKKIVLLIVLFSAISYNNLNGAQKVSVMPGPRIITSQPANPAKATPAQPAGAIIPVTPTLKTTIGATASGVIPVVPALKQTAAAAQPKVQVTTQKVTPAREIKSDNLKDFEVAQWVNGKTNFNRLTSGRIIKVAVMPGELVQTSSHFKIERKPSKRDKDGRETWKIHAHKNGNGWIKIVEKKDVIKKYHFTIHD